MSAPAVRHLVRDRGQVKLPPVHWRPADSLVIACGQLHLDGAECAGFNVQCCTTDPGRATCRVCQILANRRDDTPDARTSQASRN